MISIDMRCGVMRFRSYSWYNYIREDLLYYFPNAKERVFELSALIGISAKSLITFLDEGKRVRMKTLARIYYWLMIQKGGDYGGFVHSNLCHCPMVRTFRLIDHNNPKGSI